MFFYEFFVYCVIQEYNLQDIFAGPVCSDQSKIAGSQSDKYFKTYILVHIFSHIYTSYMT